MKALKKVPVFSDLEEYEIQYKAILWDMDGTIMNTEALHAEATVELLNTHDKEHSHNSKSIEELGHGEVDSIVLQRLQAQNLLTAMPVSTFIKKKTECILDLLKTTDHSSIFNPQIKSLMQEARSADIPQVVVTSSEKDITEKLLSYLGLDYFNFIITRADTELNKPHPEPYLLACKKLDICPSTAIVFEDSKVGAAAATAARANVFKAAWY